MPDATVQMGTLMSMLEAGDLAGAAAALQDLPDQDDAVIREHLLAFERFCADPVEPSWKTTIRTAATAVGARFFRLAELALERLLGFSVGLPKVYLEAVQLSLASARLDLAAAYLGRLVRDFPDHPETAAAESEYLRVRALFERVAALDDAEEAAPPSDPREDLGRSLLASGRPDAALEVCIGLAEGADGKPEVWELIAEAYRALDCPAAATRAYVRAATPDGPASRLERLGDLHLEGGSPQAAIRCFGLCSHRNSHDVGVRRKLAQATGRLWRNRLKAPPWSRGGDRPRYFDCFMFNGEFDLAGMRFAELWDHVEKFVVVEASETFTGQPKPMMFEENIGRFEAFRSKIVHVRVDGFPSYCQHPWARDFYQRDALVRGLDGVAADDDYVVIADADELWRWDVVRRFDGDVTTTRMRMAMNFLNYQPVGTGRVNRDTAAVARYRLVREHGASAVRFNMARARRKKDGLWLDDAGWHFHAIGDEQFIRYKFSSYAHREHHRKPDLVDADRVRARLDRVRAGEREDGWLAVPLEAGLPEAVLRDPGAYGHVLLPADDVQTSAWVRRLRDDDRSR